VAARVDIAGWHAAARSSALDTAPGRARAISVTAPSCVALGHACPLGATLGRLSCEEFRQPLFQGVALSSFRGLSIGLGRG
jgi:hypothetical protein